MSKNILSIRLFGILAMVYLLCSSLQIPNSGSSALSERVRALPQSCLTYPPSHILKVKRIMQHANQWCWAASGEMCMEYINHDNALICQCGQASKVFGRISGAGLNCCTGENDPKCETYLIDVCDACNKPWWPDFCDYGFTAQSTITVRNQPKCVKTGLAVNEGALPFEELQHQLWCLNRPVIFSWRWLIGSSFDKVHIMVVFGYQYDSNGKPWVYANNPATGLMIIPYEKYVSGSDHAHYTDFYNISKAVE